MGYRIIVNKNVALAFKLIGDLKKKLLLKKSNAKTFDFSTGTIPEPGFEEIEVEGVFMGSKRVSPGMSLIEDQVLFKADGLVDFTVYDTVDDSGTLWKLGTVINSDGYITLANVHRSI